MLGLFIASCNTKNIEAPTAANQNNTPQILAPHKDKPSIDISSVSKRYDKGSNILFKLFAEAREKDGKLDSLFAAMSNMDYTWGDSTETVHTFINNNEAYYNNARVLIGSLSDSSLKKNSTALFKELEEKYKIKIKTHEALLANIESLKTNMEDQKIMTQLYVTAAMMENYQNNELPKAEPLQNMLAQYNMLIEQCKTYQQ